MADVDMPDADADQVKGVGKSAKSTGPDTGGEGKKRFEVKKVEPSHLQTDGVLTFGLKSGMLWLCGHGILSSTTALSVEITSWTYV